MFGSNEKIKSRHRYWQVSTGYPRIEILRKKLLLNVIIKTLIVNEIFCNSRSVEF